jgi:hypothetical protein
MLCVYRGSIVVAALLALLVIFVRLDIISHLRDKVRRGPTSLAGNEVEVRVSDCASFSVGADFYADIYILGEGGKVLAKWQDPDGRQSWSGVDQLVASIQWSSPTVLAFKDRDEPCELDLTAPPVEQK